MIFSLVYLKYYNYFVYTCTYLSSFSLCFGLCALLQLLSGITGSHFPTGIPVPAHVLRKLMVFFAEH